jgi:hypothetical protein
MVAISWSVHFDMETTQNPVQRAEKTVKKQRNQSDKVGKHKYELQLLKRIEDRLDSFDRRLSRIEQGLKPSFVFERSFIEEVACNDEVDRSILRVLFEAGSSGLLPKDIAEKLVRFGVLRFQVSRRILRMNKKLNTKLNETVAERVGWHFTLTSFVRDNWGEADAPPDAAAAGSEMEKWQ